jgi:hypothetical protein
MPHSRYGIGLPVAKPKDLLKAHTPQWAFPQRLRRQGGRMPRNITNTTRATSQGKINSTPNCMLARGRRLICSQRANLANPSAKVITSRWPDTIATQIEMGVGIDQTRQKQHFGHVNDFCISHIPDLLGWTSCSDMPTFNQHCARAGRCSGGINHASCMDDATIVAKFFTGSTHVRQMLQPTTRSIDTLTLPRLALANDMA